MILKIPNNMLRNYKLSLSDTLIYISILSFTNFKTNLTFVSTKKLANTIKLSVSVVNRSIKVLVENNLISLNETKSKRIIKSERLDNKFTMINTDWFNLSIRSKTLATFIKLLMYQYANTNTIFYSISELSHKMHIDRGTLTEYIKELDNNGMLYRKSDCIEIDSKYCIAKKSKNQEPEVNKEISTQVITHEKNQFKLIDTKTNEPEYIENLALIEQGIEQFCSTYELCYGVAYHKSKNDKKAMNIMLSRLRNDFNNFIYVINEFLNDDKVNNPSISTLSLWNLGKYLKIYKKPVHHPTTDFELEEDDDFGDSSSRINNDKYKHLELGESDHFNKYRISDKNKEPEIDFKVNTEERQLSLLRKVASAIGYNGDIEKYVSESSLDCILRGNWTDEQLQSFVQSDKLQSFMGFEMFLWDLN